MVLPTDPTRHKRQAVVVVMAFDRPTTVGAGELARAAKDIAPQDGHTEAVAGALPLGVPGSTLRLLGEELRVPLLGSAPLGVVGHHTFDAIRLRLNPPTPPPHAVQLVGPTARTQFQGVPSRVGFRVCRVAA